MIIKSGKFENGKFIPDESLTDEQLKNVTSTLIDGSNNTCTYYEGDEPEIIHEEIKSRDVANWKLKSVLDNKNLINIIETAIQSLPESIKTKAWYTWEYSDTINQFSPTTQLIKQVCQLTDEQFEEIFNEAEEINI